MKLLLDENLSPAYAQWARQQGHNALSVLEAGLAGESDTRVMEYAITEQRVLVTLDADFSNILRFPPAATPGIIRLRLHPPTRAPIGDLLAWTLPQLENLPTSGKLIVVEPGRIRIR